MLIAFPLAHAQQADLSMLDVETLICEFSFIDWCVVLYKYWKRCRLTDSILVEVSSLDVHALHYSLELCASVWKLFSLLVCEDSIAKFLKVLTCLWSVFAEKFKYHLLHLSIDWYVHVDIGSACSVLDQILEGIISLLLVNDWVGFVQVSKFVEHPLIEGVSISDVNRVV